jgi:hypothetical protein
MVIPCFVPTYFHTNKSIIDSSNNVKYVLSCLFDPYQETPNFEELYRTIYNSTIRKIGFLSSLIDVSSKYTRYYLDNTEKWTCLIMGVQQAAMYWTRRHPGGDDAISEVMMETMRKARVHKFMSVLRGNIIGIVAVNKFKKSWLERYLDPNSGRFIAIGNARFQKQLCMDSPKKDDSDRMQRLADSSLGEGIQLQEEREGGNG